ncbi:hypothetical protein PGT21_035265 [Puccinia graminis f. sp. tritici]|uniref:Uncharacterized protein n=1 Tax=Puccinia graminis f. sp. tritici TaxID=56615 RepID=A0A5B0PPY3_PUCGR|nr:hypothetical protein PGT21_035265 [Puccinia graminis f. sp. tritici]KAA1133748.1 hypothetical protein PGTUg99_009051 [Puccinia graminis f. sp. tritici]
MTSELACGLSKRPVIGPGISKGCVVVWVGLAPGQWMEIKAGSKDCRDRRSIWRPAWCRLQPDCEWRRAVWTQFFCNQPGVLESLSFHNTTFVSPRSIINFFAITPPPSVSS